MLKSKYELTQIEENDWYNPQVIAYEIPRNEALDLFLAHKDSWSDKNNNYWLQRLLQEIGELSSVMAGDHEDTMEHELAQIASIALNWLRKLDSEHSED